MKKLLVVVDYQNDFVDGSLGFPGAEKLDAAICAKIEEYRKDGHHVAFTFDTHDENYPVTQEGRRLPISHCYENEQGWQLYGKTAQLILPDSPRFHKRTFGSLELGEYIRQGEFDEIELVGLVSNMCVISNAVIAKAASPEARIVIDALCTASFDIILNDKALDIMESLQMDIINRKDKP